MRILKIIVYTIKIIVYTIAFPGGIPEAIVYTLEIIVYTLIIIVYTIMLIVYTMKAIVYTIEFIVYTKIPSVQLFFGKISKGIFCNSLIST
jgi:hypothetical protein